MIIASNLVSPVWCNLKRKIALEFDSRFSEEAGKGNSATGSAAHTCGSG
jgi:hypothetical protein